MTQVTADVPLLAKCGIPAALLTRKGEISEALKLLPRLAASSACLEGSVVAGRRGSLPRARGGARGVGDGRGSKGALRPLRVSLADSSYP